MGIPLKIIVTGDTHLGFDLPQKPKVIKPRRGFDFTRNFEKVIKHTIDNNADLLLHLGDVFNRSKPPQKLVSFTFELFKLVAKEGIPVVIVPGNHERSFMPGSLFDRHDNFDIFSKPETFLFDIKGSKVAIAGFPFFRGNVRKEFSKLVKNTEIEEIKSDYKLLLFHQAIDGARVGVQNYLFKDREDIINPLEIPTGITLALSGHIHRHQILTSNHNDKKLPVPVVYTGSTERTSFVEREETKGFIELELDEKYKISFISLETRKLFVMEITKNNSGKFLERLPNMPEHSAIQLKIIGEMERGFYEKIKFIEKNILWNKDALIEISIPTLKIP